MARNIWVLLGSLVGSMLTGHAMIYDNRFWPLYPERFLSYQTCFNGRWYWGVRGVFIGADRAYLDDDGLVSRRTHTEGLFKEFVEDDEDVVDLFRIFGDYDEQEIDQALFKVGRIGSLIIRPDLQSAGPLPWAYPGKMSLRGGAFETEVYINHWFSMGGSLFVGSEHVEALPLLGTRIQSPGDRADLRAENAKIQEYLQVSPPCYRSIVFGDIDLYMKGRMTRDYWHLLHHLDVAFRLGTYIPSAEAESPYNPMSLPIGGNGHLGLYGQLDCMILFNDLLSGGFSLQVCKRLPRTLLHRMPLETEPTNYGVIVAPARVSPGVTVAFNPYVQFGGIRGGLGCSAGYFMIYHATDHWCVSDAVAALKPNIPLLRERSQWGSDHFSASVWYDFGYDQECASYKPIVSLTLDIPWKGPVTRMVPKSHAISLRIESAL